MNRMYVRGLRPGDQGARRACIGAEANRKGRINATAEDQYEELPPAEIEEHVLIQTLQAEDPTAQQRPAGLRRTIFDYMSALLYKLVFIVTTLPDLPQSTEGTPSVLGTTLAQSLATLRQVWDAHQDRADLIPVPQAEKNNQPDRGLQRGHQVPSSPTCLPKEPSKCSTPMRHLQRPHPLEE